MTKEIKHVEGAPWKIVAKCGTFEEANAKRNELSEDKELQVKVHWQGAPNKRYFAVKTRVDPAVVAKEKSTQKKRRRKRTTK